MCKDLSWNQTDPNGFTLQTDHCVWRTTHSLYRWSVTVFLPSPCTAFYQSFSVSSLRWHILGERIALGWIFWGDNLPRQQVVLTWQHSTPIVRYQRSVHIQFLKLSQCCWKKPGKWSMWLFWSQRQIWRWLTFEALDKVLLTTASQCNEDGCLECLQGPLLCPART